MKSRISHEKAKEKWEKLQEYKKKTCLNCTQLFWRDGNPCCAYIILGERSGVCCIHPLGYEKKVHERCYDKFNGKNV